MLLSLISSHLLILSFIFFASGAKSHPLPPPPKKNRYSLCQRVLFFSSCSFMASSFTFRFLILFEFIFVVISISNSVSNVLISFLYMQIFGSPKRKGHTVSPQANEKMLQNISNHQGNINQNHAETSPHTCQKGYIQKEHK